ncbi:MAG: cotJB [Bacilli bacterium]|nr:cotJB [Bacilli bacterium]
MNERDTLLRRLIFDLQKVSFALVELQLYLDTNEADPQVIHDFNQLSELQNNLKRRYETEFGPLLQYGYSPAEYPQGWVENPWPWEL